MKVYTKFLAIIFCVNIIVGCTATQGQLLKRASFDLNCSESQINVIEIDSRTSGVRGCGSQATYVENCQPAFMREECTWVLNSDERKN
jgi:hypothetical protein